MKANSAACHCYKFCFPNLETLLQAEDCGEVVVVRATRNTFSERRKTFFIRELASEGFIAETHQWFSGFDKWSPPRVCWLVDSSWLTPGTRTCRRTNRFMTRLIAGAILLWLMLLLAVLSFSP